MQTADTTQTDAVSNGAQPEGTPEHAGSGDEGATERQRSAIVFPYGSLGDAEDVAEKLQETYGGSATPDQLAHALGSTLKSGGFRVKLATARTFGVLDGTRGAANLSTLGRRLVDPTTRDDARVEAFLAVPLFAEIFKEFQGQLLPADAGLEKKMADLGVSTKQTAKARSAFQRSAERAGFFQMGRNRLVKPPTNLPDSKGPTGPEKSSAMPPATSPSATAEPVLAMWHKLLREGRDWSAQQTHDYVEKTRQLQEFLDGLGD